MVSKPKPFRLYAEDRYPTEGLKLIGPPYSELTDTLRITFSGPRVAFFNSTSIEVKEFTPKTSYKILKILIQKNDGTPAFKSQNEWKTIWIRLVDKHGSVQSGVMLSSDDIISRFVDINNSQIRVALPIGHWRIQVSANVAFTSKNSSGISGDFWGTPVTIGQNTENYAKHIIKIR